MSHSRHSVWPQTLHFSCPRLFLAATLAYVTFCLSLHKQPSILHIPALFLDSVVQRVLHKSRSVWVLNNTRHSVYIPKNSQPRQVQAYYQKQDTGGARTCLWGGGGSDTIHNGGRKWKSPLPPQKHVTAPPYYSWFNIKKSSYQYRKSHYGD